jgi:hypothetical protein
MNIDGMSPGEMVAFIMMAGSPGQNAALDALLDLAAQIDSEWGHCMSADWFRANPSGLDEPFLDILREVAR